MNMTVKFTLKDIFLLISLQKSVIGKAYVTFLLSSGLKKMEALDLTIQDLINACHNEFLPSEDLTLENLLKKEPNVINPLWVLETNAGTKITFSSGESLFYLFIDLNRRYYENKDISPDEKLFVNSQGNVLSTSELNRIFAKTENAFHNTEKYHRVKNSEEHIIKNYYDSYKYSSKDLRTYFKLCCENYFPEFTFEKGKLIHYVRNNNHSIKKRKLIKLFYEGLNKNDEYFKIFTANIDDLYKTYSLIEKHLTAKNYQKVPQINYYPYPEYNELLLDNFGENYAVIDGLDPEVNENLNFIDSMLFEDDENKKSTIEQMANFLDEFLKENLGISLYDEIDDDAKKLIRILKSLVEEDINNNYFKTDEWYLDELWERAILKFRIKHQIGLKSIYIHADIGGKVEQNEIVSILKENDIFEENGISEEFFIKTLDKHLKGQRSRHRTTNISADLIGDMLIYTKQMQR